MALLSGLSIKISWQAELAIDSSKDFHTNHSTSGSTGGGGQDNEMPVLLCWWVMINLKSTTNFPVVQLQFTVTLITPKR